MAADVAPADVRRSSSGDDAVPTSRRPYDTNQQTRDPYTQRRLTNKERTLPPEDVVECVTRLIGEPV